MDEKRVQRLAEIFKISDSGFTRQEFLAAFKKVMEEVLKLRKDLISSIDYKEGEEKAKLEALRNKLDEMIGSIKPQIEQMVNGFFEQKSKTLQELSDKIDKRLAEIKDGDPGKDADPVDEEKLLTELLKKVKVPQIDESRLKALEDELKRISESRVRFGGGGFSKIAMDGHIVDDETPSGTVNGVNVTFTLAAAPNPVSSLHLYNDGQRMKAGGEDFTLSGNTITYVNAPLTGTIILADYRT